MDTSTMKVAVFGGSFSCNPQSQIAKKAWARALGVNAVDFGVCGTGFLAGADTRNDIPHQIRRALASHVRFRAFILWASTNDINGHTVEEQNEAIERCVATIRAETPGSAVLFFASMPCPLIPEMNETLGRFVCGQIDTCARLGVPCLDLYHRSGISAENADRYTLDDRFHPNEAGYGMVKDLQVEFIRKTCFSALDIRDFGAAENNSAVENAAAMQKAIDAAAACCRPLVVAPQFGPKQQADNNKGVVVVPPGTFLTGTLWLRSHVELRLEKGAVLKTSTRPEDYNANDAFPENFHSTDEEWSGGHLLLGYKVEDVAITGEGTIDGSGLSFFGEPDEDSRFPGYKYGLRLHPLDRAWFRPGPLVAFFLSKGIRLEGVKIVDSPCWTTHFRCCEGVTICGVSIRNDRTIANTDGFSIDCSRNVTVSGCTVVTGDDAVAIRASCGYHAAERPCENIVVEDCDFSSCSMGVRIGIGTGTIRDVVIRRCRIHEAAQGIKFHAAWRTGSKAKGVDIKRVRVEDCDVLQCDHPVRNLGGAAKWRLRDVVFERCRFESLQPVTLLGDEAHHPENIVFRNCSRVHLDHLKVRHHRGYGGKRSREFLQIDGKADVRIFAARCD